MIYVADTLRSKYDFDKTPCGNGVGWLAMKGRFISAVDLVMQGAKCGAGNALAPVAAVGLALINILGTTIWFQIISSGSCEKAIQGLKKLPGDILQHSFALVLTVTVGIIANTLLRIITIVGNALGILFPEVGQTSRKMDVSIARFCEGNFFGNFFHDDCGSLGLYLLPRPFTMIASQSNLYW